MNAVISMLFHANRRVAREAWKVRAERCAASVWNTAPRAGGEHWEYSTSGCCVCASDSADDLACWVECLLNKPRGVWFVYWGFRNEFEIVLDNVCCNILFTQNLFRYIPSTIFEFFTFLCSFDAFYYNGWWWTISNFNRVITVSKRLESSKYSVRRERNSMMQGNISLHFASDHTMPISTYWLTASRSTSYSPSYFVNSMERIHFLIIGRARKYFFSARLRNFYIFDYLVGFLIPRGHSPRNEIMPMSRIKYTILIWFIRRGCFILSRSFFCWKNIILCPLG